eukprot:CAMPEP_0179168814 /NCGR_PEP_ID=MMETSP0796-20121207/83052_1 /TAXON_ID=73915 /ORGANISM="Pyrodinium bahamense, Strain pbaha01" /LENGTH=58 /DNA_ID=CAMNT_0020871593 /DNA_START=315 /DNA_END=488 /DNA_ORIENTATION=+
MQPRKDKLLQRTTEATAHSDKCTAALTNSLLSSVAVAVSVVAGARAPQRGNCGFWHPG